MKKYAMAIEWEVEGSKRIDLDGKEFRYRTYNVPMAGGYEMEFSLN